MTGWSRDILGLIGLSLLIIVLVMVFREHVQAGIDLMGTYSGTPLAVIVAFSVFLIGSIFLIPQWMLIAAAIAAFGLVEGVGIAWAGTLFSAAIHVTFAKAIEGRLRDRLGEPRYAQRMARLRRLFARNSFQSGFIVRLIPTGPAIVVNMAAGIVGVHRTAFLAGTALGIIPKILLAGIVASELISSAQGQQIGLGLVLFGLIILAVLVILRRSVGSA